jgi:diaminohydroxyphosphoribosylaminopyrimidine deaminase / 5-amino-6-(5-phosphoribosylamino)uracil reductase
MYTNQNNSEKSIYFMNLALNQAKINLGNTKENPSVGCVIVKNNNLISASSTSLNGRPHAETNAINYSKTNVKDSILYVTLEPCSNHGKTPPWVDLIIKKKIKKVIFSIFDPDTRSYKKSIAKFKKKKIDYSSKTLEKKTKHFYKSYIKNKKDNLPFVTSKLAVSKDFYTVNKKKKWIKNFYSKERVN